MKTNFTYEENLKMKKNVKKLTKRKLIAENQRELGIIKTLYLRKVERVGAGKKITTIDERYFKLAENYLHGELALALQVDKDDINQIIIENIEGNNACKN